MNRNILIWIFFKVLDHYTKLSFAQCSLDGFLVTTEGPCFYDLEVTAKFYQNESFLQEKLSSYELEEELNKLFIEFELISTSKKRAPNILVESCWATTSEENASSRRSFIVTWPGCVYFNYKHVIILRNNGQENIVQLEFPVFFIQRQSPSFYIHCAFGAVSRKPQCTTPTSFFQNTKPPFVQSALIKSFGPFIRINRDKSQNLLDANKKDDFAGVLWILVAMNCTSIILIICYFTWKYVDSKSGNYKMNTEKR